MTGRRRARASGVKDLSALLDREAVRDGLARVARGEDRRDAALIRTAFWPDAAFDYGVFKGGFEAYLAWVVPGSPAVTDTQHVLGQSFIEIEGSTARVETHVLAYHRIAAGGCERDICIGGRYLDRMEKRDGEWRIARRTMLYDWQQDWGAGADWSKGLMGAAFSAPTFVGQAAGDHSETFFGRGDPPGGRNTAPEPA